MAMRLKHSAARRHYDEFVSGYVEAALWSSTDESDESGGEPLDRNYSRSDIAASSMKSMKRDCAKFFKQNRRDLQAFVDDPNLRAPRDGSSLWGLAGYCFWMNANGHGVGFWDRDVDEALGERLSEASHKFASDMYVGDDGEVYVSPER